MKTLTKAIILFIFITCIISCKKKLSSPGCDINGYWIGNWESNKQLKGTFISLVKQNLTDFSGNVKIHIDSPESTNYSTDYEGTVKDRSIQIFMDIKNIDIIITGNVSDNNTVAGEFKVPSFEMEGSFTGEMLPSSNTKVENIYSFTPTEPAERIHDILCIDDKLWIFIYPSEYINEEAMFKTIITDLDGNVLSTSYFPCAGHYYSYNGEHIWSIENGTKLMKFDIDGNLLSNTELSFDSFDLSGDGEYLYFQGGSNVIKTDLDANVIDTITFEYTHSSKIITYKNNFLSCSQNSIYKYDKTGKLLHADSTGEIQYISRIVTNNDKVFVLVEDYDPASSDDWSFYIYKITL